MQTTTLTSPDEVRGYLLDVGTPAPALHPDVDSDDPWKRWNGWNATLATGIDAAGLPVNFTAWHFASGGRVDFSAGIVGCILTGGDDDDKIFEGIKFPVEALPAVSHIRHPQHTPQAAER